MFSKFLPWKWLVRRIVRRNKFLDPFELIARLRKFSQPSEVSEPIELLRAGAAFHARGLLNSRVIQHNMDWIWPYWVARQFSPGDPSFVPRAFSLTHINLTHRNWTAVGLPDCDWYPVVDPRGLVTPELDGWSLDLWIVLDDGRVMLPSYTSLCEQNLDLSTGLAVETRVKDDAGHLYSRVEMRRVEGRPELCLSVEGQTSAPGWICLALRPCNPEGVQLIDTVVYDPENAALQVNDRAAGWCRPRPDRVCMSDYAAGDVFSRLTMPDAMIAKSKCPVGMCTAALMYRTSTDDPVSFKYTHSIPGRGRHVGAVEIKHGSKNDAVTAQGWNEVLSSICALNIPDAHWQFLYDASVRTVLLLSSVDIYPGPYTYKRFWFRDACLMLHALLKIGRGDRVELGLNLFVQRQAHDGYFKSQEGEWDSNGQVLWLFNGFREHFPENWNPKWMATVRRGAEWICRKLERRHSEATPAGLLPAGFSAEHLGPNDFYYWDNLWSVAGLRAAAMISRETDNDLETAERYERRALELWQAIERSRPTMTSDQSCAPWPAAPSRRMDAGAIGSLVADYPLMLFPPGDDGMMATVDYLLEKSTFENGFFQNMIHSGINAYLTLDMAETLLRAGDGRWRVLVNRIAELASPTGQWPEAIHPHTGGGCMGDGQHGWAAAEWILMMAHLFLREEEDELILLPGFELNWLAQSKTVGMAPLRTRFGTVRLSVESDANDGITLQVAAQWHRQPARIQVRCPGCVPVDDADVSRPIVVTPET